MGCEVSSADAKQVTEFKEFVVNVILHIHSADASTALGHGRKRRHLQGWLDADTASLLYPKWVTGPGSTGVLRRSLKISLRERWGPECHQCPMQQWGFRERDQVGLGEGGAGKSLEVSERLRQQQLREQGLRG